jgi:hypothetical protein
LHKKCAADGIGFELSKSLRQLTVIILSLLTSDPS